MVVAAQYPLALIRPFEGGDNVVNRLELPIGRDFQVYCRGSWAYVVGDWQPAAPLLRGYRSLQRREHRGGIVIGNWQDRDLRDRFGIFDGKPLRLGSCANPRCKRIAGI